MQITSVSIIGAGNLSWHISQGLKNIGIKVNQIYSRNLNKAKSVAALVNAEAINSLTEINPLSDLILICVSDSAIEEVANAINFEPKLIAHTAGSTPLSSLSKFKNSGVFYILQSFTKGIELDLTKAPFCIEGRNKEIENSLINLAKAISNNIYTLNSEKRLQCHLAAVFANNFSNHMFHTAEQILKQKDIPFDILKPIIIETAKKIMYTSPSQAQTGPAARNDKTTIEEHLNLISDPEMEKLYSFVSQNIWTIKQQNS